MTELDGELPEVAEEIIAEFGKTIQFGQVGEGAYDTATSTYTPVIADPADIKAIVEPYRGQRMLAGLVEAGDMKLTIAARSLPDGATTEDVAVIDDVFFKVVNVLPTYSGDLVAIYELQVRR